MQFLINNTGEIPMANSEHENLLEQDVEQWNQWREQNPEIIPDLSGSAFSDPDFWGANLQGANLAGANWHGAKLGPANFGGADLSDAVFVDADFNRADFTGANLRRAKLLMANLTMANLTGAQLQEADLSGSLLVRSNLSGADLRGAKLFSVNLTETNLQGAHLTGCSVYGISVWNVDLTETTQEQLIVSGPGEPVVTVDNLEMAQFVYLLLNNKKIRDVIDTITSKMVLILGRFTTERKQVLDAIRDELRRRNYTPVVFDFDIPANRDITETVSTLAHMSRFIIADLTDAKSIPQELMAIVPDLPSVPVQPLLQTGKDEYSMFEHFRRYPWVMKVFEYVDTASVIAALPTHVIDPAEAKAKEMAR
jgi:uncharacterized protein YjbI with pentapeptide repeats